MTQTPAEETPKWSVAETLHALIDRVFSPGSWEANHAHAGIEDAYPAPAETPEPEYPEPPAYTPPVNQ